MLGTPVINRTISSQDRSLTYFHYICTMIEGVVYRYVSPDGKSYVGQTTNEHRRKLEFKRQGKHYTSKSLTEAIHKFGLENFVYEVLYRQQYETKEEAQADLWLKETFFIEYFDSYNNGYNNTLGGNGTKGHKVSKEQVEKQRLWLIEYYKTHPNPFKGKKHSVEAKKKLSEYAKLRTGEKGSFYGKKHTDKAKKAMSACAKLRTGEKNHFFGKVHNEFTKRKISEANSVPVLQIDAKTNEVIRAFSSAIEAGKSLGNPRLNSEIVKCCKGYVSPSGRHYLTCKGYKWKYQE